MINREHDLPITKQALVLRISRGSVYYLTRPMPEADLAIMRASRLIRRSKKYPAHLVEVRSLCNNFAFCSFSAKT